MSAVQTTATSGKGLFTYENGLVLLLGSSFGFAFFDRQALSYLTPFIAPDLHLNNTMIGALASGLALSWAISSLVIAAWSDATGVRKPFLLGAILIFSLCSMLSGLAGSFMVLLAARVLMGAVEGPFLPICLSVMSAESSPRRRGLNAGIMQNSFSAIMLFLAPVVLVWLAQTLSWRAAFFIAGAPGLILFLLVLRFVREPRKTLQATPSGDVADAPDAPRLSLWQLIRVRNIWLCCLISCCLVGWTVQAATFLPLFFVQYRHFTPGEMAGLMSVIGIATGVAGPLAAAISDRIGRKPVMVAACLLALLTPLAALYYSGPLFVLGALIFIGWMGSGLFSLFMGTIPAETISLRYAATCMGLIVCVGEIVGGFIAPILAGKLADLTTLQAPLLMSAGFAAMAAGLSLLLRETAPVKTGLAVN